MSSEAERLERLWGGTFGEEYTNRCRSAHINRKEFWGRLVSKYKLKTVLEVGCNSGGNLKWISPAAEAFGLDINKRALAEAKIAWPDLNLVYGAARDLPFRDAFFDLTFTCGVLIHQPEESLREVMAEVIRCSKRYVLAAEYYAKKREEIPYRRQEAALFKDDFGAIYKKEFKLIPVETGELGLRDGFNDPVTYWLFERT